MNNEAGPDRIVKIVWQIAAVCLGVLVISYAVLALYGLIRGQ
jgi:hypothetical protein